VLFHATGSRLPDAVAIHARVRDLDRNPVSAAVERAAEALRPRKMPSRLESFFLAEHPASLESLGASRSSRIYRVYATSPSKPLDAEWLVAAAHMIASRRYSEESILRAIKGYWSGRMSPTFKGWEILSPCIVVERALTPVERKRALDIGRARDPELQRKLGMQTAFRKLADLPVGTAINLGTGRVVRKRS
jgi:hypothetical protein